MGKLLILGLAAAGVMSMTVSADIKNGLTWEWPSGREPDLRIMAEVVEVDREVGGLLGLKRSPSLLTGYPDPMRLTLSVMRGVDGLQGQELSLTLPKVELGDIEAGDTIALGIVNEGVAGAPVSICIGHAPAGLSDAQASTWLSTWRCGGASAD